MPESYDPLQGYAGILSDIFKFVWTAMPFILRYPSIGEHNCNIAIVCARDAGSTSETIYSKHKTACCISLWKFTVKTSLYFNSFYFRAFLKCFSRKEKALYAPVSIPFISGLSLNPVYKNSSFQSYSYLSYFQFFPFFHTLWFRLFPFCTVPVRMSHFFRRVAIVQGEDTPYSFPVCLSLSKFR